MARSQPEFADARTGLDLLSAHDEGDPRLSREDRCESSGETRKGMLGGGANSGILQLNQSAAVASYPAGHLLFPDKLDAATESGDPGQFSPAARSERIRTRMEIRP